MSLSTRAARDFKGTHTAGRTPEELRELVSHVGAELELAPAEVIIEWAVATFGDRFAITSSMGDAVLAHLASKVAPGIDVVFLDTGYHFVETIGPLRTLTMRSQTVNPASSAIRMKSQCAQRDRWLFTMSVILASSRPRTIPPSLIMWAAYCSDELPS